MSEKHMQQFTAKIADAAPIRFEITPDEEPIYRKACYHVNLLWNQFRGQNLSTQESHAALAKVALAFAELYYRKSDQLREQDELMRKFEADLDKILE